MRSEVSISLDADLLEKRLASLYEERRGMELPSIPWAFSPLELAINRGEKAVWCHGCGKNAIFVSDGGNLCEDCELTVEVEAENCQAKK